LGVYWLFLVLCRPYDDTIFMTYEIITNSAQLAMLIVIILGYYELIEAPKGAFIGLIALVLLGQILTQVRAGSVPCSTLAQNCRANPAFSQLQGIAHERIMFSLEIVHMVCKRFNWYRERQEKVMERVKR
jgi:hypothetical protein